MRNRAAPPLVISGLALMASELFRDKPWILGFWLGFWLAFGGFALAVGDGRAKLDRARKNLEKGT